MHAYIRCSGLSGAVHWLVLGTGIEWMRVSWEDLFFGGENRTINYFLLPNNYIKLETYQHRTFSH